MPKRIEQFASRNAAEEQAEDDEKQGGATPGRGRARGRGQGRGRGRGRGAAKAKATPTRKEAGKGKEESGKTCHLQAAGQTVTPPKKAVAKSSDDLLSEPKVVKPGAKKRKGGTSDEPEMAAGKRAASKGSPKASKAKAKAKAKSQPQKEKSFARRWRPNGEKASVHWQVIRDTFDEMVREKVTNPSKYEAIMFFQSVLGFSRVRFF